MFLFASLQTEPAVQQGRELEELLLQVAAGDWDALGALYHRTRAAVYGLALSYLKRQADAEDVTHDDLRALTDQVTRAIQSMSGQEYVDEYAQTVKKRLKEQAAAQAAQAASK